MQTTIKTETYTLTFEGKASEAPKSAEVIAMANDITTLGGVEEFVAKFKPTTFYFASIEGYEVSNSPNDVIEKMTSKMGVPNIPDIMSMIKGMK